MNHLKKRLAVAPMMDWTDRHCRRFHRSLSQKAYLYTEMVTTGALMFGDVPRHLDYHDTEHPIVLQLGGSDPHDLAQAVKLAQQWAYDEVDLNCGCPSERVQKGSFGACLMAEPKLVADCVKAMVDASELPVSVKHRLGLDDMQANQNPKDYQFTLDFICEVAQAGASQVTIHARNAVLKGLSPKENRTVPALHYDTAKQLRKDAQRHFPHLRVLLNGGLETNLDLWQHWHDFDGFMVGRAAYHTPTLLLDWDSLLMHEELQSTFISKLVWDRIISAAIEQAVDWLEQCQRQNKPFHLAAITRHILGLAHGIGGSKNWRRYLSDYRLLSEVQTEAQIHAFFEGSNQELRFYVEQDDA